MKGATLFVELNDGSCLASIQVVCGSDSTEGFASAKACGGAGASLRVEGAVVESPGKGQTIEILAKAITILDILVPRIGEIIGGSQREDSLEVLEERAKSVGLNPEDIKWYGELRQYGSVPHAGFGLGFERLVMLCSGVENIRDVIPFPRTPGNCRF